jgi:type II secretion system protein N
MNDRLRQVLEYAGYSAWFGGCFFLFVVLTFPWSRVRDQVMVGAANNGSAVVMQSLRPAFVGAKAKQLSIGSHNKNGANPPPFVAFETIKVKTGPFGALGAAQEMAAISGAGGTSVSDLVRRLSAALGTVAVDGRLYSGNLDLDVEGKPDDTRFIAEAKGLNLAQYAVPTGGGAIASALGSLTLAGGLDLQADVDWHWEDPKKTGGNVDLAIDGLVLDGVPIVSKADCSVAVAHLKMSRGRAEFRDTELQCDVVEGVVEGYMTLNPDVGRSRLALKVRFKLRDDLDNLAKAVIRNQRHKDDEGWYHYQVNGTLKRWRFKESPSAVRKPGRRSRPEPKAKAEVEDTEEAKSPKKDYRVTGDGRSGKVDRSSMSDEDRSELEAERERLREERMQRREERRARREELLRKRRERQEALANGEDDRVRGGAGGAFADPANVVDGDTIAEWERKQMEEGGDEGGDEGVEDGGEEGFDEGEDEGGDGSEDGEFFEE